MIIDALTHAVSAQKHLQRGFVREYGKPQHMDEYNVGFYWGMQASLSLLRKVKRHCDSRRLNPELRAYMKCRMLHDRAEHRRYLLKRTEFLKRNQKGG
jgi:hypothetical protein